MPVQIFPSWRDEQNLLNLRRSEKIPKKQTRAQALMTKRSRKSKSLRLQESLSPLTWKHKKATCAEASNRHHFISQEWNSNAGLLPLLTLCTIKLLIEENNGIGSLPDTTHEQI